MSPAATVQIIGAAVACSTGVKDSWRETAEWAAGQLHQRYGEAVQVHYYDLFDPDCPALPAGAQLPVVLVNGGVVTMGGKISIPAIRRCLEEQGIAMVRG